MNEFFSGQSTELSSTERERPAPDVRSVAEKYQVMLLHAISPNYVPDINSALNNTATWQQKLKIDLAFQPSLSASTFKDGDNSRNLWNSVGVILQSGSIEHASSHDSVSRVTSTGERYSDQNIEDLQQEIDNAITQRDQQNGRTSYNEFIISRPKIAGFFITRDQQVDDNRLQGFDESELHKLEGEIGLPIYIIENGHTYAGHFDANSEKYTAIGSSLQPADIQNSTFEITEDKREAIINELAEDSPFKIPEIPYLRSRAAGRQDYMELTRGINYRNTRSDDHGQLITPKNPKIIDTFAIPGGIVEYLEEDGQLFVQADDTSSRWRHEHTKKTSPLYDWEMYHGQAGTHIRTGGPSFDLGRKVMSQEDYFQGTEKNITDLQERRSAQAIAGNEQALSIYDDQLQNLACHIYGFGEQAASMGDNETRERAFALANRALPFDRYQSIINKLDDQGHLKISRQELEQRFNNSSPD